MFLPDQIPFPPAELEEQVPQEGQEEAGDFRL